jgi:hypothetical protein
VTDAVRQRQTQGKTRVPAAEKPSAIDLSKRDLTLDLARVFCVLLVVAIHLMMVGVGLNADGQIVVSRPLETQPWFAPVTWVGQIMPLFFVVGGFASLTAWRSLRRRNGTGAAYVRSRVLRLAQPALPLYLFYVVALVVIGFIGVDPNLVATTVAGTGAPLWFLAAYLLVQAVVPLMVRLHERAPRLTLLALLAGVIIVDIARFSSGITEIGLLNLFFVWVLIHQFGFWYADGWFGRRTWWQLLLVAVGCYALLYAVCSLGLYPFDMLRNLNPPTLPLVLLGLAQACLLRVLRPALAALMRTTWAKGVVFLAGTRLMTIYLWHLPVIVILTGLALLIPGASPEPASPAWWWSRIPVYLLVLAAIYGLSFLVGRWEAPREVTGEPPIPVVVIAAVLAFTPNLLVLQFFMDLPLAILGSVFLAAAVLMLGRWPSRPSPSEGVAPLVPGAAPPGR